ncbi:hypothetical protein [Xinfangfangia pollutisoli]|uniref:hypothetical protein n=1 Tax=Xinfangfangia pollutisoli TaxID=2865960 RepID=UPI001CD1AEF2|nr:hypothetical protein [Xinfangfangia pollutisoli]
MSDDLKLTQTRIRAGIWEGVLTGAGAVPPKLDVLHLEKPLAGVAVTPVPGREGDYAVRVPIPSDLLSEGVQTFLIRSGGETLAHFTVITGVPMEDDLRAEIDLLRAELDMLKRAFRRHCLETAG